MSFLKLPLAHQQESAPIRLTGCNILVSEGFLHVGYLRAGIFCRSAGVPSRAILYVGAKTEFIFRLLLLVVSPL